MSESRKWRRTTNHPTKLKQRLQSRDNPFNSLPQQRLLQLPSYPHASNKMGVFWTQNFLLHSICSNILFIISYLSSFTLFDQVFLFWEILRIFCTSWLGRIRGVLLKFVGSEMMGMWWILFFESRKALNEWCSWSIESNLHDLTLVNNLVLKMLRWAIT